MEELLAVVALRAVLTRSSLLLRTARPLYVTGSANLPTPIRTSNNHSGSPIIVGDGPNAIAFAILRR